MKDRTLLVVGLVVGALVLLGGGVAVVFVNRLDFARRLWAALVAYRDRGGTPLPPASRWILLAQAAYETNWGKTAAARGRNWFNLSAGAGWTGPVTPGPDTEPDGKGGWRNIEQAWRAYPDDLAAIDDLFSNWLSWSRYQAAKRPLLTGDTAGYLAALRAGGYFTQDLPTYTRNVTSLVTAAQQLLRNEATT